MAEKFAPFNASRTRTGLRKLYLENNQLLSLPENIGELNKLEQLWVSGNQIALLPATVSSLKALTSLKAANNKLTTLPRALADLSMFLCVRVRACVFGFRGLQGPCRRSVACRPCSRLTLRAR